jgi:Flp pilus assembly protein TadG
MGPLARVTGVLAAIKSLVRDGRGGVAIEFAFVIPIAILLTFGAVEVARAVSVQDLDQTSRQGHGALRFSAWVYERCGRN